MITPAARGIPTPNGRLTRLLARLIPSEWRETVVEDLVDEAQARERGGLWLTLQILRVSVAMRWSLSLDMLLMDLRYAVRSLASARWFTAGAVLTFALGIGVNVAVFAAVDRVLFRPLPYSHPEALAVLRSCNRETGQCFGAFPGEVVYRLGEGATTIADVGIAARAASYTLSRDQNTDERYSLISVSSGALRTLGVNPAIGRGISEDEIRDRTHVAWISDEAWRSRLRSDPAIVGRLLWSGNTSATIIGVLPKGFIPPAWSAPNFEWAGLVVSYDNWTTISSRPDSSTIGPFVRLKPGATIAAAQAEVTALAQAIAPAPSPQPSRPPVFLRVDALDGAVFSAFHTYLWLIVGVVWLVGLMACTNLASLFLARARSRERQAAVASALGASSGRLLMGAIMESLCVCSLATVLALWTFATSQKVIGLLLPPIFSRYAAEVHDARVLGFAVLMTLLSALVAGAVPAWRLTKVDVLPLLQKGAGGGRVTRVRGGRSLLAIEAAFGAFLVLGAVLASRSFIALARDDVGFAPDGLYVATIAGGGRQSLDQQLVRTQQALEAIAGTPGVALAATGDYIPFGANAPARFSDDIKGARVQVSSKYFSAMGASLLAGRLISDEDIATRAMVAVMSRSAVRAIWPDVDPSTAVGRAWQPTGESGRVVVGVVSDFKRTYGEEQAASVFLPMGADPSIWDSLVLRAQPGQTIHRDAVLAAIRPRLGDVRVTLNEASQTLDRTLQDPRFRAALLTALAFTGLLLAAVGLYAVASYEMAMRRYEMGVRLALGATSGDLKRLIIRDSCVPVAIGAAIGLVGAWWTSRFAQSFLYGTDGHDAVNYVLVVVVLLMTAAAASWFPARRAAATDPAEVLRAQ